MDYREVSDFFGGSVFLEEYRTNLAQAETRIQALQIETAGLSIADRAKVLLLKAILHTLCGEILSSNALLKHIFEQGHILGQRWSTRCQIYMFWNFSLQLAHPVLRFQSGLEGLMPSLTDAEVDSIKCFMEMEALSETMKRQAFETLDQLEVDIFKASWAFNTRLGLFAFRFHPRYPPTRHTNLNILKVDDAYGEDLKVLASRTSILPTLAYLDRLSLEFQIGRASPDAQGLLRNLRARYESSNDDVGLAITQIIQGDSIVSPPFSSPIAFNLKPTFSCCGWKEDDWDRLEPTFRLRDDAGAQACYTAAMHLFEAAGASRGQAAVFLRRACIQHMEAIWLLDDGRKSGLFDEARMNLDRALQLFAGDGANRQVVIGHQILLDISTGRHTDVLERSASVGAWGFEHGYSSISHFVGLLLIRFGRRRFLDAAQIDTVLLCCKCASACFAGSGDTLFEVWALLTEATVLEASGSLAKAQLKIDEIRSYFQPPALVLEKLDDFIRRRPDCQVTIRSIQFSLLNELDGIARGIYSHDMDALDGWIEEHKNLTRCINLTALLQRGSELLSTDERVLLGIEGHGQENSVVNQVEGSHRSPGLPSEPSDSEVHSVPETDDVMVSVFEGFQCFQALIEDCKSAIQKYRQALDNADIDEAEGYLWDLVDRLEVPNDMNRGKCNELKVRILSRLGAYGLARNTLPHALNEAFGGSATFPGQTGLRSCGFPAPVKDALWRRGLSPTGAIACCVESRDWNQGWKVLSVARDLFPDLFDLRNMQQDDSSWERLASMAAIYEHNDEPKVAFKLYLQSQNLLETRRKETSDLDAKREQFGDPGTSAVFSALTRLSLGFACRYNRAVIPRSPRGWNLPGETWFEQGLLFLERGRARSLLDLLLTESQVDSAPLKNWAATSYKLRLLTELRVTPKKERTQAILAEQQRLEDELKKDRENVEKESISAQSMLYATQFTADPKGLFSSIEENTAVIQLNLSAEGLILICITSHGIQFTERRNVTELEMTRRVLRFLKCLRHHNPDRPKSKSYLRFLAEHISEEILWPVSHIVRDKEHIIFIPSRMLHVFPFSTLLFDGEPLCLQKAISQVPSMSALQRLVSKSRNRHSLEVCALAKKVSSPAELEWDSAEVEAAIPMASVEAFTIARMFKTTPVDATNMKRQEFVSVFERCDILHIGTHGHLDASPWKSYISLREKFRVIDMAQIRSHAALVVFSVCVSGLGRATTGEDVLGFSHAVLQSGALAFLGCLWNVDDVASLLQMTLFYRKLAQRRAGLSIAMCWREAQIDLYNLDIKKARSVFSELLDAWDEADREGLNPDDFIRKGRQFVKDAMDELETEPVLDFKHPYVWAPFVLVGHGGLILKTADISTIPGAELGSAPEERPPPLPPRPANPPQDGGAPQHAYRSPPLPHRPTSLLR